ncbi:hypothetical protein HY411_00190 [Candidatus Gottesmanbacteria bacterium]|nr:hypothetical protein [Candidatus Gottesmanbacteria bacterium]
MSPDDIRQQIELKVVELIKTKLADGSISEERSQQISQMVLSTLTPGMTLEALYKAIPKLDDAYPELSPIILPYLREYEDKVAQTAEVTVRDFIRQGKYDAATQLAKKAIAQDIDLVWTS